MRSCEARRLRGNTAIWISNRSLEWVYMPSGNLSEVKGSKTPPAHPLHPTRLCSCWQRRASRLRIHSAVSLLTLTVRWLSAPQQLMVNWVCLNYRVTAVIRAVEGPEEEHEETDLLADR